jgi:RHS repeat-associated protein
MVRAETITVTQVYTYNGDGLLVAQSIDGLETAFTWDQALDLPQVLATSDGTLNLYGLERLAVLQGDTWYYPQHDALGSVRQWADALGVVLATQAYSPFGVPRDPLGVAPWGFTGEWHGPMGMVYLRARWYNPQLGRFTQVDPFPGLLSIPATRHPYAYALNDPLNLTDPSGEAVPAWLVAVGIGATIGAVGGAISYVVSNPRRPMKEYVRDRAFWQAVGVGAASGAVAGGVGFVVPSLFAVHSMAGAMGVGALTGMAGSATGQVVTNLLTPCTPWHAGILGAALSGGITGGIAGGIGYGVRMIFGTRDVTVWRLGKGGVSVRSADGRIDVHRLPLSGPGAQGLPQWAKGHALVHYHRRGGVGGIASHRPWQVPAKAWSLWDLF